MKLSAERGFRKILDVQHHTGRSPERHKRWIADPACHDLERTKGGSNDPLDLEAAAAAP